MKEEKDPAKEAFDAPALAQFLFGPGGRQAGAVLLPLGCEGQGTRGCPFFPSGQPQAKAKAGQERNQSRISS